MLHMYQYSMPSLGAEGGAYSSAGGGGQDPESARVRPSGVLDLVCCLWNLRPVN
jgi:hypothetical protein